jgi:hypothetical protein
MDESTASQIAAFLTLMARDHPDQLEEMEALLNGQDERSDDLLSKMQRLDPAMDREGLARACGPALEIIRATLASVAGAPKAVQ